jgi:ATP-binding cassette, subfamily C, bacterial LapB
VTMGTTFDGLRRARGRADAWIRLRLGGKYGKGEAFVPHGKIRLSDLSTLSENVFDLALASLFLNLLGLAMPLSMLQIYDRILPNHSVGTMVLLLMGVLVALVLESTLSYARSFITGWVGARFEHKAACLGLERMLMTSLHIYEREGSGVHLDRMSSLATVRDFYAGQALMTFMDLPFALIYLSMVGFLGGILVFVPIVLLVFFVFFAMKIGTKLRGVIHERMVSDDRRFNFLIEVLGGIHSVKAMAMEAQMVRRYERLQENCAKSNYNVSLESSEALSISAFFNQITMLAVVACGSLIVMNGHMTTGGLAACSMLAGRAMTPLQRALSVWTRFQSFLLARERIEELFQLPFESKPGLPPLPTVKGGISFENVSFRFADNLPWVIKDLSINVEPGECVGITGDNGCGKTSLLALMQGTLRPTSGVTLVDGLYVNNFDPKSVREQIAHLPQMGVLFQGTILQNLTMFRPSLENVAIETANMLGLDEVVASMAFGFDTMVGEGAFDSLPRGIKQRIAITRSLVSNPRIVLFDEANASMDTNGDNFLRVWLERSKGKRTLILVTPRPSLLKLADRIYDLKDGSLILRDPGRGSGPPPSLAANPPAGGPSSGGAPANPVPPNPESVQPNPESVQPNPESGAPAPGVPEQK